jgi:hypothetical protein
MSARTAILLVTATLALSACAARADDGAEPQGVGLTVQPLTYWVTRTDVPLPVLVTIINPQPSLEGVLEARVGDRERGHVWRQDLRFGRGRFGVCVYPQVTANFPEYRLNVRVLDRQRRVVADASLPIRFKQYELSLLSLAGPERRWAAQDLDPQSISVTSLRSAAALPDRWYGYQGFDAVFWDASRTDKLAPAQVEALTDWVRGGGRLILGAKQGDASLCSPVAQLVPSLTVVPASADTGGTVGGFLDVAEFPSASPETPFVERAFGLGRVVWLRVDFNSVGAWPASDMTRLMGAASTPPVERMFPNLPAPPAARPPSRHEGLNTDALIEPVLARMAGYKALKPAPILATMVIYILLVSVVDYGVLKRLRRLPWTWLTFPALIAVFSAFSFRAFYRGRLGRLSRHEVVFHDVGRDGAGRSRTLSCIQNNSNRPIEFTAGMSSFIRALRSVASPSYAYQSGMAAYGADTPALSENVRGDGGRTISIPGYVGSYRFFSEERIKRDAALPFACRWQRAAGVLGQVVNNTGQAVKTGFLFHKDRIYSVGPDLRIVDSARNFEHAEWSSFDDSFRYGHQNRAPLEAVAECVQYQPFKLKLEREPASQKTRVQPDPYSTIFGLPGENEGVLVAFSEENTEDRGMPVRRINCIRQIVAVSLP